jgi:hypothetical protein
LEERNDDGESNKEVNLSKDSPPRKSSSAEEITDWIDEPDNNGVSWEYLEERDGNKGDDKANLSSIDWATPPINAVALHCTALPPPHQLVISNFATQNTHGLRCRPCNINSKSMIYEPHDYTRYEHLITSMKTKSLDVYFMQETWLEGDVFDEVINGYHIFRHNGGKGNHSFRRVAIILLPCYYAGWKAARARPLITTDSAGEFASHYISINVILNSCDRMGKQIHGKKGNKHLALILASVYHPCTKTGSEEIYVRFLDTLDTLLIKLSAHNEIIMGRMSMPT